MRRPTKCVRRPPVARPTVAAGAPNLWTLDCLDAGKDGVTAAAFSGALPADDRARSAGDTATEDEDGWAARGGRKGVPGRVPRRLLTGSMPGGDQHPPPGEERLHPWVPDATTTTT